jgi:predicted regulator of Ras-like GTPase activity (Roadblock/LC7/MglB family)
MLNELLIDLSRASQGNVEASAIISKSQGLTICTHYPEGVDEARIPDEDVIAGRSTQIQEATRKVFKQLKRGALVRTLIEGETGYVIICDAGDDAILSALTNKRANIGYMFFMMTRIAKKIEKVLS